jgi:hypothetical protein
MQWAVGTGHTKSIQENQYNKLLGGVSVEDAQLNTNKTLIRLRQNDPKIHYEIFSRVYSCLQLEHHQVLQAEKSCCEAICMLHVALLSNNHLAIAASHNFRSLLDYQKIVTGREIITHASLNMPNIM